MVRNGKLLLALVALVVGTTWLPLRESCAQVVRYQPSTPTVSPFLNLFQNGRNGRTNTALNYYNLVRPLQQQNQTNQVQQRFIQQQANTIDQLQLNLQQLEQNQKTGQPVRTGHAAWFNNPGTQSRFLNTSQFYSRAGTVGQANAR